MSELEERFDRLEAEVARLRKFATIVSDLDRCEHGRHEGDVCSDCGGPSKGNPVYDRGGDVDDDRTEGEQRILNRFAAADSFESFGPDRLIGFTMSADPICVPARADMHDPDSWVRR